MNVALLMLLAAPVDHYDQSQVPLEVDTSDPKLAKVVLVAGKMSHAPGHHEYFAGLAFLAEMLKLTPGVHPVMVRDGWPKNPKVFEGARAVVFYNDGGQHHPLLEAGRMDLLQKQIDKGMGFTAIHYAVNFPKEASSRILSWLGGHFDIEYSSCPACVWTAYYDKIPTHPITRGVPPFTLRDEWYFHMRFVPDGKGVTAILRTVPPAMARTSEEAKKHAGEPEITSWAYERPNGGRSFGYSAGHFHDNWGEENVRRLVVNGILWTAKVEIPKDGAKVDTKLGVLSRNLDDKRPKK